MEADLIVYVTVPEIFFVWVGIPNTDTEELLEHKSKCTIGQSQNVLQLSPITHITHLYWNTSDTGGQMLAYTYE